MNETVEIADCGRGPQIVGQRITVLDVFYYLHRGYDFDFIHQALPSLTRQQYDALVAYVKEHQEELVERDGRVEEFIRKGVEAQHARGGLFAETKENLTTEERIARLKDMMRRKLAEQNGACHSR